MAKFTKVEAPAEVETPKLADNELQILTILQKLAELQAKASSESTKEAIAAAIAVAKPDRITVANRKSKTPWDPPAGKVKPALKRKFHQHGMIISAERLTAEQIELINKLRPGNYLDNNVQVIRRRDKGIDLTYKVKSATDKQFLASRYGITSLTQLLSRCVEEGQSPKKPDLMSNDELD